MSNREKLNELNGELNTLQTKLEDEDQRHSFARKNIIHEMNLINRLRDGLLYKILNGFNFPNEG